jgi:hypothetical protein
VFSVVVIATCWQRTRNGIQPKKKGTQKNWVPVDFLQPYYCGRFLGVAFFGAGGAAALSRPPSSITITNGFGV